MNVPVRRMVVRVTPVQIEIPKGRPEPPKPLEGDALDEWTRMVERLELTGALSKVDDAAIYRYAKLFAQTEAIEVLQEQAQSTLDVLNDNVTDGNCPE